MSEGAWIFLSHSNKDFDEVCVLRNDLERLGHHPLMFFLKCLDDDSEIDDLIRREIEARSWFVLCDSANSRASRWVQQEWEIINNLAEHNAATVDLAASHTKQLDSLGTLTKRASVFLSFAHADRGVASQIESALRTHDFGVFSDLQITPGSDWAAQIQEALDDAAKRGAVLVLLSKASLSSEFQRSEVEFALSRADPSRRSTHILPIFLESPSEILPLAPPPLHEIQGIDFSEGAIGENLQQLMRALRRYEWGS